MGQLTGMRPKLQQIAITSVLALIVAICTPVFVHRHDFEVALTRWMKDQSTENLAISEEEARKNMRDGVMAQIVTGCVAFLLLNGGWFLVRRVAHSRTSRALQAGQ
jgi:hypothetical protein